MNQNFNVIIFIIIIFQKSFHYINLIKNKYNCKLHVYKNYQSKDQSVYNGDYVCM